VEQWIVVAITAACAFVLGYIYGEQEQDRKLQERLKRKRELEHRRHG
jgi:hypothetical protein